jgi:hypothetical protein
MIIVGDLLLVAVTEQRATPILATPILHHAQRCRPCAQARGIPVAVILAEDDEALIGTLAFIDDPLHAT